MRIRSLLLLVCLALVSVATVALAQDEANLPHVGNPHGDMNLDCKLCHSESSWDLSEARGFDHASTGFVLEGMHKHALCRDCHKEPEFAHVGTQCVDCHSDTHRGRLGPVCTDCHTVESWVEQSQMRRDHNATAMPLVGAHERVDCDACHEGAVRGDYVGTPTDCYACHADTYAGTENPDHQMAGFGTDCERCHGVFSASWGSGDFIHDQRFPLTGAHRRTACVECHSDGFAGTPTECVACHQSNYDNATDPNHVAANFSTDCRACHSTTAWEPATFDHNTTAFALTGAHRGQDCIACHSEGFSGTPTDCAGCHQSDYDATTDPNHQTAGFPTDCTVCHTTTAWQPADFDHNATAFPLTGAHTRQDCLACHSAGYSGTPTACVACHQSDYDNTTDPNHQASGFPTDCKACHTTSAWEPANFDHNATAFPLTGAHRSQDCLACHSTGYSGTATACAACHQSDYDNTTDPNHQSSGFPVSCQDCHTTNGWTPSTWDHDVIFPINSGKHQDQWNSCTDCHVVQTDYSVFECIFCHKHNRTDTDDKHREVRNGYQYLSAACLECHPRGRN